MQPNVDYYSRINVVCKNGEDSENYAEVHFITIIAELIVIGREGSATTVNYTIQSAPNFCTFPLNGTETDFKVRQISNPNIGRRFLVNRNPVTTNLSTKLKTGNTGEYYPILCDNTDPNCTGESYQIKFGGQQIATFELSIQESPVSKGLLTCTSLTPGFEIVRFGDLAQKPNDHPNSPTRIQYRAEEAWLEPLGITASPNPFSESLTVYLDAVTTGPVSFNLFNLSGQKVFDQQYPAGAEQYDLNTSHLPSGFYLLRVGAGEELQTLKVVKSE
ncbi:MAG: T9SS type A sorting domain-containing protein [Phycisphaerae bacterium]|nr:T9SS type A sorting domain-containing protein [Saprospiraceae bacterium]